MEVPRMECRHYTLLPKTRLPKPMSKSKKETPTLPGTPKSKTPKGMKSRDSSTPRTPRSGTPRPGTSKATPKSYREENSYVCEICGEELSEKKEMLKHQRLHGRHKPEENKCTPKRVPLTRTPKSSKRESVNYECEICHKKFRFRSNLKSHALIHQEQKVFNCRQCQRSLIKIAEGDGRLMVERLSSPESGSDVCKGCCHDVAKNVGYKIGTGQREDGKFMCEKCARTFGSETNLKMHMKTHAIDKIRDILKTTSSRFTVE